MRHGKGAHQCPPRAGTCVETRNAHSNNSVVSRARLVRARVLKPLAEALLDVAVECPPRAGTCVETFMLEDYF